MVIAARGLADRLSPWPAPRAVLFDLDDTLIDRSATLLGFAERLAADFADHLADRDPAQLHPLVVAADKGGYRSRAELTENLLSMLPWHTPPPADVLTSYWSTTAGACTRPSAGALGLIAWLRARGVKTGIVTNGPPTQHVKIDTLGVRSHMDAIVVSEELGVAKPDPRIFRHAARLLRVAPRETWFVGDHPVNDVAGAHAVGMRPFWLRRMQPWPAEQGRIGAAIDSLEELLPLLVEGRLSDMADAAPTGALAPTAPT